LNRVAGQRTRRAWIVATALIAACTSGPHPARGPSPAAISSSAGPVLGSDVFLWKDTIHFSLGG